MNHNKIIILLSLCITLNIVAMEKPKPQYQSNKDLIKYVSDFASESEEYKHNGIQKGYYERLHNQADICLKVLDILFYINNDIPLDHVSSIQNTYLTTQLNLARHFCLNQDNQSAQVILKIAKEAIDFWGAQNYSKRELEKKINNKLGKLTLNPNINPFAQGRYLKNNYLSEML